MEINSIEKTYFKLSSDIYRQESCLCFHLVNVVKILLINRKKSSYLRENEKSLIKKVHRIEEILSITSSLKPHPV